MDKLMGRDILNINKYSVFNVGSQRDLSIDILTIAIWFHL